MIGTPGPMPGQMYNASGMMGSRMALPNENVYAGTPVYYNQLRQGTAPLMENRTLTPSMTRFPQAQGLQTSGLGMMGSVAAHPTFSSDPNNAKMLAFMKGNPGGGVVAGQTYASPVTGLTPEEQAAKNANAKSK